MATEKELPDHLRMIRIGDAAKMADVSERMVMKWINAGHIRVFVPPGHRLGDAQRGPKSIRIPLADWKAFLAANTGVVRSADPAAIAPTKVSVPSVAIGTDGISRRNETPAQRRRRLAGG